MAGLISFLGRSVKELVEMGFPEPVAKRISSGELPMDDKIDVMGRQDAFTSQGNMPDSLYHWTGSDFNEFTPSSGGKYGAGVYLSPDKLYGEKYVSSGTPKRMEVRQSGKIANIDDISSVEGAARAKMKDMQYEPYEFSKVYWDSVQQELKDKGFDGLEYGKEVVVFDPAKIRSADAAFDPEYTGSNILGSRMAPTIGAAALGGAALMGSEDAEAGMIKSSIKPADDAITDSYRGGHQAPDADYGAPLHDLTEMIPEDIYGPQGQRYYGLGDPKVDREAFNVLREARGNPEMDVPVYRAVPKGVEDMYVGDWVSTSPEYAKMHGENALGGDYDILEATTKAKKLQSEGYPYEFGLLPASAAMALGLTGSDDAMALESALPMAAQAAGQTDMSAEPNYGQDFGTIAGILDLLAPLVVESVKPQMMGDSELTDEQRRKGYFRQGLL